MSDEADPEDKTEDPTPRRIEKGDRAGQRPEQPGNQHLLHPGRLHHGAAARVGQQRQRPRGEPARFPDERAPGPLRPLGLYRDGHPHADHLRPGADGPCGPRGGGRARGRALTASAGVQHRCDRPEMGPGLAHGRSQAHLRHGGPGPVPQRSGQARHGGGGGRYHPVGRARPDGGFRPPRPRRHPGGDPRPHAEADGRHALHLRGDRARGRPLPASPLAQPFAHVQGWK